MKFVTKKIHAYLDYPVAIALITLPLFLGLGDSNVLAFWLSLATGVAAFILTVLTDHELGVVKVVPYSFHLLVDFIVGVTFLIAPFGLGFGGIDAWFYWANGAAVLLVVGLHQPETTYSDDEKCQTAVARS